MQIRSNVVSVQAFKLGDGAVEIAVRRADTRVLWSVITHACAGADWFWHPAGNALKRRFKSKKAAIDHAVYVASEG